MKKIATIVLILLTAQIQLKAQTAEEIVANYLQNIGGEEALRAIKGTRMTAKVNAQGMELPLEIINMSDGKMLVKFELQGQEIIQQAFDGETAWGINFMTQKAEKSDAEDTENIKRQIGDYPDVFLDYTKKGYTIELMGKETVEGTECFKVKLTKKPMLADGEEVENVNFYYFDTENFIPIVVEAEIKSGQMKGSISQTVYSDYQEVNGVYFPFSIDQRLKDSGQGQPVVIEKVEVNPEIDEAMFKFVEAPSAEEGTK
ncbi:MAG: outer membrane lipoprotein-sorting protein [Flavobacteriales bacterium]|nr:outer membrane lipoprotein-sorting protein [Flavobacteriales bacterium]